MVKYYKITIQQSRFNQIPIVFHGMADSPRKAARLACWSEGIQPPSVDPQTRVQVKKINNLPQGLFS